MFLKTKNKFLRNLFYFVTMFFAFPAFSQENSRVILVNFLKNALFSGQVCLKNKCSQTLHLGDTHIIHNPLVGDELCVRIADVNYVYEYLFRVEREEELSEINFWGTVVDRGFNISQKSIKYIKGGTLNKYGSNSQSVCSHILK
jgi:hypothetical protein